MLHQYHLFVYGSLRQGFGHSAYSYIDDYFQFVSHGKVKGLVYDLGEYPAAVPTRGDHFIIGELYCIRQPDEFSYAIAQLDDYEGIDPAEGSALYRREICTVFKDDGTTAEAWIYWYNGFVEYKPIIHSGDVLEYMKGKR